MPEQPQTVTIDDKEYTLDNLSDKAKNDMASMRVVDQKIEQNKQELAILQTARNAYARSLKEQLPEVTDAKLN
jgi:hypothetical protein